MSLERPTWKWALGTVVLYVVLALWIGRVSTPGAFIDFSYARSLATGHGLVFSSLGPGAEGYSSFLWVLLSAALIAAGVDVAAAAPYLSLAAGAGCIVVVWRVLARRATRPEQAIVPLFVFATAAPFLVTAMGGTDGPLFALLLATLVAGADRLDTGEAGGAIIVAAASVLAMLCRVEGTVVALAGVWALFRAGRRARPFTLVVLGAVVVYHAWRVATFGALVPASIAVRAGFNAALFSGAQPHDIEPDGIFYLIAAVIALAGHAAGRREVTTRTDRTSLALAGVMALVYLGIRDATPAQGNVAALLPLAVVTWPWAVRAAVPSRASSRATTIAMVAVVVLLAMGPVADQRLTAARIQESHRDALRPVGEWLHAEFPGAALATDLPGAITWYADLPTLDLRARSPLGAAGRGHVAAFTMLSPEIVILDAKGITNSEYVGDVQALIPALNSQYRVLAGVRTAWTYDRTAVVLLRRDIPPLTDAELDRIPRGVGSVIRLNR